MSTLDTCTFGIFEKATQDLIESGFGSVREAEEALEELLGPTYDEEKDDYEIGPVTPQ